MIVEKMVSKLCGHFLKVFFFKFICHFSNLSPTPFILSSQNNQLYFSHCTFFVIVQILP